MEIQNMRKYPLVVAAIFASFLAQSAFAAMDNDAMPSKHCAKVAVACKSGGYTVGVGDKSFWFGCMKPLLWGKTVSGVTIDPKEVSDCRSDKITKMKEELKELEAVK
jgi:hypothetical protein